MNICRSSSEHSKNTSSSISSENSKAAAAAEAAERKKPHIKKPLNAFMLYMKEMRAQVNF